MIDLVVFSRKKQKNGRKFIQPDPIILINISLVWPLGNDSVTSVQRGSSHLAMATPTVRLSGFDMADSICLSRSSNNELTLSCLLTLQTFDRKKKFSSFSIASEVCKLSKLSFEYQKLLFFTQKLYKTQNFRFLVQENLRFFEQTVPKSVKFFSGVFTR